MAVAGIKNQDVAGPNGVLLIFTCKGALSGFYIPNDIVLVKMAGEGPHKSLKAVGLNLKIFIIYYSSYLSFHTCLLAVYYTSRRHCWLVKYLQIG